MTIYCHSSNEEIFHFEVESDSRTTAVQLAGEEYESGETFYVGVRRELHAENYIDGDDIIELLACRVYDRVGEVAEGWPDATKEQTGILTERLQRLVREWLAECEQVPTFYAVDNVTEHSGTSVD